MFCLSGGSALDSLLVILCCCIYDGVPPCLVGGVDCLLILVSFQMFALPLYFFAQIRICVAFSIDVLHTCNMTKSAKFLCATPSKFTHQLVWRGVSGVGGGVSVVLSSWRMWMGGVGQSCHVCWWASQVGRWWCGTRRQGGLFKLCSWVGWPGLEFIGWWFWWVLAQGGYDCAGKQGWVRWLERPAMISLQERHHGCMIFTLKATSTGGPVMNCIDWYNDHWSMYQLVPKQ